MSIRKWSRKNKMLLGGVLFSLLMCPVSYYFFNDQIQELRTEYMGRYISAGFGSERDEVSSDQVRDERSIKSKRTITCFAFLVLSAGLGAYLWTRHPSAED